MTFNESIPIAKQLAENSLKKGFDVEAFLVLAAINSGQLYDPVPESNINEHITDIGQMFIQYMHNRTTDNLYILVSNIRQLLSELYHNCSTEKEKTIMQECLQDITNIFNPTII